VGRRERETTEEHLHAVFGVLTDGVISLDREGRVLAANPSALEILGVERAALDDAAWWDHVRPAIPSGRRPPLPDALHETRHNLSIRIRRPSDGRRRHLRLSVQALDSGAIVLSFRDCTEELRAREQLETLAHRDRVTGLPNRRAILERIDELHADGAPFALVLVNVDGFSTVNTGFGHAAGDAVLSEIAGRLRGAMPRSARPARFGGDEFLIVGRAGGEAAARALAERVLDAFAAPFQTIDGAQLTASVGIALGDSAKDPAGLVVAAEAALERAQARGRGLVAVFDDQLRASLEDRLALVAELRRAIERDELDVVYQPIVTLERDSSVICAVEALARWTHRERGAVPPATFVPLAEDAGLIRALGRRVLARACLDMARVRAELPRAAGALELSVNVSARQVASGLLEHDVRAALTASGLEPSALALELTETALMDDAGPPLDTLGALRKLGVRLVIDDFGTGYSSLGRLRRLPLDGLKIDGSFVAGLEPGSVDTAIVEAVLTMARALDLPAVAERVETSEQAQRLIELGCPRAQGYLLGRPMQLGNLRDLLSDGRGALRPVDPSR
jgi:diguanylate cyclase (GGDEF)-like protein/PAS domain S-box-containing protein